MANQPMVIINGKMIDAENASLHISDLAIQRGYGVFDFFKTLNGSPVFLTDHLDRLYRSLSHMRLEIDYDRNALKNMLYRLMDENNIPNSGIKITVTGGYATDGYTQAKPNIIITQQPLALYDHAKVNGLKLVSYQHQRQMASIKTIDYLMAVWLQPFIKQHGCDDVLYNFNGLVTECPRANFFIVSPNNVLVTPANNVLHGITRKQILRISKNFCQVEERDITLDEVYNAKEVFVSNCSKNMLPVYMLDNRTIGNGSTGELTATLSVQLLELIDHEITANAAL